MFVVVIPEQVSGRGNHTQTTSPITETSNVAPLLHLWIVPLYVTKYCQAIMTTYYILINVATCIKPRRILVNSTLCIRTVVLLMCMYSVAVIESFLTVGWLLGYTNYNYRD